MAFVLCLLTIISLTPFKADKVEIIKENGASIVYLVGNVIIEQEETNITCAQAKLNESAGYVELLDNITITDKEGSIKAQQAIYYLKDKKALLRDSVQLIAEDETICSDTLDYNAIKKFVNMYGRVKIIDEKNKLTAYGSRGWYDLNGDLGSLTGSPELEIARASADTARLQKEDTLARSKEPMKVKAREFMLYSKQNRFLGFDSVVAVIDSITIKCDTFSYDLHRENGTLTRPVVSEKENELKGTFGHFQLKNKNLEFFTTENGWASYYTREGSKNLVEGDIIKILFKEGNAHAIIAMGNPRGTLKMKKAAESADN